MTEAVLNLGQKPNRIHSRPIANEYYIKLHCEIGDPDDFADELDVINSAAEGDVIVLDICTVGGSGDTAALFVRALRGTLAHTIAIIGPTCASAGSLIALACREWVLDETSSLMIHTSSYGLAGKDVDIMEHAVFARKHLQVLFSQVYSGFLNEEELADVIKGTPIYFLADELEPRLIAFAESRAEAMGMNEEADLEQVEETPKRKRKPKQES